MRVLGEQTEGAEEGGGVGADDRASHALKDTVDDLAEVGSCTRCDVFGEDAEDFSARVAPSCVFVTDHGEEIEPLVKALGL